MTKRGLILIFTVMISHCFSQDSFATNESLKEQTLVALRVIGHELLLNSGDSTSRILPITQEEDRFKIPFENSFSFHPELLSYISDSIISESQIASAYLIEVQDCDSGKVVYSFEVNKNDSSNFIPCQGRPQPEGCYVIFFRIITPGLPFLSNVNDAQINYASDDNESQAAYSSRFIYLLIAGILIGLFFIYRMVRNPSKKGSQLIRIGSYLFDHKNMTLAKGNQKQELTGKESELLQLLYFHLNSTVDRDIILKEVWRDEGAYIGRTLDVYISKLRKKFETDPAVRIINVRGVGYKMTLD